MLFAAFFCLYRAMMRLPDIFRAVISTLLVVSATSVHAQAPAAPAISRLSPESLTDLRCAAAFAIVATQQSGGDVLAGWPSLAVRGKQFFADTGERAMREGGMSREAVRDVIAGDVRALQTAPDPEAALNALAAPCLARLDAAVAPLVVPDLKQCAAIMTLAYDELHAREGLTSAARDLRILASVLTSREHEALVAAGRTSNEADRMVAEAREAMAREATDGQGGIDKYDIARCYELAKPDEKSHY